MSEFENLKAGDILKVPGFRNMRVMAVVDGYVMARYSGCIPFCQCVKQFKIRVEQDREFYASRK